MFAPNLTKAYGGKNVVITGGSEGIGFALACELIKAHAANVTLIARNADKLANAKSKLVELANACRSSSNIHVQSADVTVAEQVLPCTLGPWVGPRATHGGSMVFLRLKPFLEDNPAAAQIASAIKASQAQSGAIDLLVCNAGASHPAYFHEMGLDVFEAMMRLNYFGTLYTVKAVYDDMVARNSGCICLIASALSLMSFVGYGAYSPSKYAVRGLADTLRNELQGTGVKVSVAFPPDTVTPGFEHENLTKPVETHEISESADKFQAEQVAKCIAKGLARGDYVLPNPDLGIMIHTTAVLGMIPRSFPWVLIEMLIGWIAPVLHAFLGASWDRVARKHASKRFSKLWQNK